MDNIIFRCFVYLFDFSKLIENLKLYMQLIYILRESFQFAFKTIIVNKLRTFLSLLGITIGIFAIISVFTILDSLEDNVRESLASLGNNVIYIQKWPWAPEPGQEYAWWKYWNRPLPSIREYNELKKRLTKAQDFSFVASASKTINYRKNSMDNVSVVGVNDDFENLQNVKISRGRFLSPFEMDKGRNLAVIGSDIASRLFKGEDPIGKTLKISGRTASIIGVFEKEGKSFGGGGSSDKMVVVPVRFLGEIVDLRKDQSNPMIWVRAAEKVPVPEFKEEVRQVMRSIRSLKPTAEDNFALNQSSMISQGVNRIFKVINIAGGVIGIFSVLVGAFGIANIMFVSVKERTNIIGIQKAIGAKRYYILLEVIYESVILSLMGGILGLILIYAGTLIVRNSTDFNIYLSLGNIVLGLIISSVVGIISGFAPAFFASRLNPVEAISTSF